MLLTSEHTTHDVVSAAMTLFQRRNNAVCPVGYQLSGYIITDSNN